MKVTVNYGSRRPKYEVGQVRLRGKTLYIKQHRMVYGANGRVEGYMARNGRILTEWVVKGSYRDQTA